MVATVKPLASAVACVPRRAFTTVRSAPRVSALRSTTSPRSLLQQNALLRRAGARTYADQTEPLKKKPRWGFLRWTWRLTQLGTVAGLVYVAYNIHQDRNPSDQPDPDPSKKTLVVLGELLYRADAGSPGRLASRGRGLM